MPDGKDRLSAGVDAEHAVAPVSEEPERTLTKNLSEACQPEFLEP